MSDKMTQAIEKAYSNMEDGIVVLKKGTVIYGMVLNMTAERLWMDNLGETWNINLSDIKSFARCDSRYTV